MKAQEAGPALPEKRGGRRSQSGERGEVTWAWEAGPSGLALESHGGPKESHVAQAEPWASSVGEGQAELLGPRPLVGLQREGKRMNGDSDSGLGGCKRAS